MRAKNNVQRAVVKMHDRLPSLTQAQRDWLIARAEKDVRETKEKNKVEGSIKQQITYYEVITTYKGWQVLRHYQVGCSLMVRKGFRIKWIDEVAQHWIKGEDFVFFCAKHYMNYQWCMQPYTLGSICLSEPHWGSSQFEYYNHQVYPIRRYTEQFKGIEDTLWEIDAVKMHIFGKEADTLSKAHMETLVKRGAGNNYALIASLINDSHFHQDGRDDIKVNKYWHAIKLTFRNNYLPVWKDWLDHVGILEELGLDTHSPFYVCPQDFARQHAQLSARLQKKRDEEERKRDMEEAKKNEANYIKKMAKWTDFVIEDIAKGIVIKPLMTVQAVADEGKAMHHCVFACKYYKKADTLLLSATTLNGERIETIEYNLKEFKVAQSRGVCNKATEHHADIVQMMDSSKARIRKIARARKSAQAVAVCA